MLRARIIVSLLLLNDDLVKTVQFKNPVYIGDPLNTVKIFNEKEVDELVIFDIGKTKFNQEPNFNLLEKIASQSRMPICYGGGIKKIEHAEKIFNLGIEKIAISSAAISNFDLIIEIINRVGSQSVVIVIDIKKSIFGKYEIYINNGEKKVNKSIAEYIHELQKIGIGEIIFNHINLDGTQKGYDYNLLNQVFHEIKIPVTQLGGAGKIEDIENLINKFGIIGAGAGSLFVFKGKYKAVLINYPSKEKKKEIATIKKQY